MGAKLPLSFKMAFAVLAAAIVVVNSCPNAHALTTVEIVAKAKPAVVTLTLTSTARPDAAQSGTGFFISDGLIITAAHVVTGDWDRIVVVDLAGKLIVVEPQPSFADGSRNVDLTLLKVSEPGFKHAHLQLRTAGLIEGQSVVVISNPQGLTGTVSTGIVSALRAQGDLIQFTAPVSNGSSGAPLLDDEGDVIGVVDWVLRAQGNDVAENLNFAHGISLVQYALANQGRGTVAEARPIFQPQKPRPVFQPQKEADRLVTPTHFGRSRTFGGFELTEVLDEEAIVKIALPVYGYLLNSAAGESTRPLLLTRLSRWFNLRDVTAEHALANDAAYNSKWPQRRNTVDAAHVVVEQLTTYGDPWYMVTMPYSWSVKNGKKSQRGKATALAIVVPGHYEGSNKAAYFIAALWNANNEKSVRLAQKN